MDRKEYLRQYYLAHKEQYLESQKRYNASEKGKETTRRRNAQQRSKPGYNEYMKNYMKLYRQRKKEEAMNR